MNECTKPHLRETYSSVDAQTYRITLTQKFAIPGSILFHRVD